MYYSENSCVVLLHQGFPPRGCNFQILEEDLEFQIIAYTVRHPYPLLSTGNTSQILTIFLGNFLFGTSS